MKTLREIIEILNNGTDPKELGLECVCDDGTCKLFTKNGMQINCTYNDETNESFYDDDVSGWNQE